jgi:hypothetical protein
MPDRLGAKPPCQRRTAHGVIAVRTAMAGMGLAELFAGDVAVMVDVETVEHMLAAARSAMTAMTAPAAVPTAAHAAHRLRFFRCEAAVAIGVETREHLIRALNRLLASSHGLASACRILCDCVLATAISAAPARNVNLLIPNSSGKHTRGYQWRAVPTQAVGWEITAESAPGSDGTGAIATIHL